ncbi:MAG: glycosyltransferase [Longimicrobiales bacterium]
MSIVLLPNASFLSETSRMLAIREALEERGMDPVLATHGGTFEWVIRDAGVPYERLDPPLTGAESQTFVRACYHPGQERFYPDAATLRAHVEAELDFFDAVGAEAVVSGFTLSAALSARGAGVPLVVTHLGSWVPPMIDHGRLAAAEYLASLPPFSLLPAGVRDRLFAFRWPRLKVGVDDFNRVADALGIERVRTTWDVMHGDLTLVTDVPEIAGIPEGDLEAWRPRGRHYRPSLRFAYAGPLFARLFGDVPETVASFLETDEPTVLVSMSSSVEAYVRTVRDTVAAMPVRAVIAGQVHADRIPDADNVMVTDYLPAPEVMPRVDAAVIHGGQGTVQTAIAGGTPFVGFPLQPEQNFNLRQVERHGAGRTLSLRALERGELRTALTEVLEDPSYAEAMGRLQAWQAGRDGPTEVARVIRDRVLA